MDHTKFQVRIFDNPGDLAAYVVATSNLATVVSIISDASGKYVLFYLTS